MHSYSLEWKSKDGSSTLLSPLVIVNVYFQSGWRSKERRSFIYWKKYPSTARVFNLLDGEKYSLFGCGAGEVLRKLASPTNPTDDPIICSAKNILPTRFHKLQFCYCYYSNADSVLFLLSIHWMRRCENLGFGWSFLRRSKCKCKSQCITLCI